MTEKFALALCFVSGLGPKTWLKLYKRFKDHEKIIKASSDELAQAGAPKNVVNGIISFTDWDKVERHLEGLEKIGARILAFGEEEYPKALMQTVDPPMVLFIQGKLLEQDELALSVVGTRKAGDYGKRIAFSLSKQVAQSGVTIVSGMAEGIDSQAHRGALEGKGRTIAVVGTGLDHVFPARNKELSKNIARNGAVISEFPLGIRPHPGNFPRRNRIIAGLCSSILVVESPKKSGSRITARFAIEQGKDVLVVPGRIDEKNYEGSHLLIREGAKPVFDAVDIFESVLPETALRMDRTSPLISEVKQEKKLVKLPHEQGVIFENIGCDPIHVDALAKTSGLTIDRVLTILLELELRDLVVSLPGKLFRRKSEAE